MSEKDLLRVMTLFEASEEAERLVNVLRNAGQIVRDLRGEDAEDMESILQDNPVDIILAKQRLTDFTALEALEILQRLGRDIPLVVICEPMTPDAGLAEMQAGAADAVCSDQEDRLLLVVRREVNSLRSRKGLRRCEQMLHESEKRARNLIDHSRDAIAYVHDGMHIYANQAYLEMFGYESLEDVEGMPILDMVSKEDHATLKQFLRNYSKGIGTDDTLEIKARHTDGNTFDITMEFSPASMEGEACTQIIIRDRTDSKELEQQLSVLTKQDLLTGLYNRTYFLDQMDKLISHAVTGETEGGLLFIDVDNFEAIRNTIGFADADHFLNDVAQLLKERFGELGLLARFEGANFTLLLDQADLARSEAVAQQVIDAISEHRSTINGRVVTATVSIGVTHINETISNLQDCLIRAEKGCEIAQKEGGNRYNVYNPKIEELEEKQQVSAWSHRIKEALRNNEFKLLFQPIVSLHGVPGAHYEVLVRMLDENAEEIPPGEFIPPAEQADLTKYIDRWVIANVFRLLQQKRSEGQDTRFFVKISQGSLLDAEFLPWVAERLRALQLETQNLIFELNEETALNHLAQAKALVEGFKSLHCRTALENFGLEPNTFQSMEKLPVDFIKIHGKLIHNLAQSVENQEKVKQIAQEAHNRNMQVIAAFVEDANSLAVLWQCSVDFIQGHFLQMPAAELDYEFESAF